MSDLLAIALSAVGGIGTGAAAVFGFLRGRDRIRAKREDRLYMVLLGQVNELRERIAKLEQSNVELTRQVEAEKSLKHQYASELGRLTTELEATRREVEILRDENAALLRRLQREPIPGVQT